MSADSLTGTKTVRRGDRLSFLAPGVVLADRYRIDARVGAGGMGEVWRAYDLKLREDVALKSIVPQKFSDSLSRELIRREVRAARSVTSPNVCRIYDLFESDGHELVSMELVDGTTLQTVLEQRAPLDLLEAQKLASQLLSGLQEIHAAGLVHRDVKPSNVMVTRSGRVVLMDFGLARGLEDGPGSIVGTPAYMAPEQSRGEQVGPAADLYSAAIVLTEMISPGGVGDHDSQRKLWEGIRSDPPRLPDTPWSPALCRALRSNPSERCASAAELLRMLEEATLREEGAEHLQPYPGLAIFEEEDAAFFFGRELEIERMWRRLGRPRLQALIGPSGSGKSSFIRAGLLPTARSGWVAVVASPGLRPFLNLARALAPELGGDLHAIDDLLRVEEPDVAVSLVHRWRQKHDKALLVLDQFEELFTQNPAEVQEAFAQVVARLPLEADTHLLLSMRDDFLFQCTVQPSLSPLFSDPFPLQPLSGAALRRALVQPALDCGYRFEDDGLVEEILTAVEGERGALPLMAFTMLQLWERRDRTEGLLTRAAYDELGGVAGSLARHAEVTLEHIGSERLPIVRELFRNLVTAQDTRVAREREELLSVFPEESRAEADDVLEQLVDARLLTAWDDEETVRAPTESIPRHIELVHESLLTKWPRLSRWRAEETGGARLRDELRQAAKVWDQHGRDHDYLWIGTAFREFELWHERYPGALTALEEEFATAMTGAAGRRLRLMKIAVTSVFVLLLAIIAVVGYSWRVANVARQRSEEEANRATAAELLALGRADLENDWSAALAYVTESLRLADSEEARNLASEILWLRPAAFMTPEGSGTPWDIRFSPDGSWLGVSYWGGELRAYPADGRTPIELDGFERLGISFLRFGSREPVLTGSASKADEVRVWSTEDWSLRQTGSVGDDQTVIAAFAPAKNELITFAAGIGALSRNKTSEIDVRRFSDQNSTSLGMIESGTMPVVDPHGKSVAYGSGSDLRLHALDSLDQPPTVVAVYPNSFRANNWPEFDSRGEILVAGDQGGHLAIWSAGAVEGDEPLRRIQIPDGRGPIATVLSADLSLLCVATGVEAFIWNLRGVTSAEPIRIARDVAQMSGCGIHPDGLWAATPRSNGRISLWNLEGKRIQILKGHEGGAVAIAFSPDSRHLYSLGAYDGKMIRWPLDGSIRDTATVLFEHERTWGWNLSADPHGRFVVVTLMDGNWLVPLNDSPGRPLDSLPSSVNGVAIDPRGERIASTLFVSGPTSRLTLFDIVTGETREMGIEDGPPVLGLAFDARGRLLINRGRDLQVWDPATDETITWISQIETQIQLSPDRTRGVVRIAGSPYLLDFENDSVLELKGDPSISDGLPLGKPAFDLGPHKILLDMSNDGDPRVGRVETELRHPLYGHRRDLSEVAISPDGRWVAGSGLDGIYLWPMPDLNEAPLHALPHDELIRKLESLTNIKAVPDETAPTGYRIEIDDSAYRGWKRAAEW